MIAENLAKFKSAIPEHVQLVAVSKTKPNEDLLAAYNAGQRIFGENKVQEVTAKYEALPKDIDWHFIGHLQTNKVKYIAPFIGMIHSLDSIKLAKEIQKRAVQNDRSIHCLLQVHIAEEESKFGIPLKNVRSFIEDETFQSFDRINIRGLMGMATNTEDINQVKQEFEQLKSLFDEIKSNANSLGLSENLFDTLSMGMSGDYDTAIEAGSTMIRVGSSIFGARNYQ
jgi:pyridoxal phosphate enzyme (YggS family)